MSGLTQDTEDYFQDDGTSSYMQMNDQPFHTHTDHADRTLAKCSPNVEVLVDAVNELGKEIAIATPIMGDMNCLHDRRRSQVSRFDIADIFASTPICNVTTSTRRNYAAVPTSFHYPNAYLPAGPKEHITPPSGIACAFFHTNSAMSPPPAFTLKELKSIENLARELLAAGKPIPFPPPVPPHLLFARTPHGRIQPSPSPTQSPLPTTPVCVSQASPLINSSTSITGCIRPVTAQTTPEPASNNHDEEMPKQLEPSRKVRSAGDARTDESSVNQRQQNNQVEQCPHRSFYDSAWNKLRIESHDESETDLPTSATSHQLSTAQSSPSPAGP
ncbi:uncharacterized protein [Diadema setosum]|uniref:uncharacterized protein n=1 Tax=Diadema setosum TaxID=31175 RepID=UPI003B3AF733